jgi:cell wall-associated NlpC family hydrolase
LTGSDLEVLRRAHDLFTGATRLVTIEAAGGDTQSSRIVDRGTGEAHRRYQVANSDARTTLLSDRRTDAAMTGIIAGAHRDHAHAREATRRVLDEAGADTATTDNPVAQREAARRRIARLRAQQAHVSTARVRARRHAAALRALQYRRTRRHRFRVRDLSSPSNSRAGIAVRAALSRLGRPYVWGATGPDQFDCSGLVRWSYAHAGVHLGRTTYEQICEGVPVSRAQVRAGDLVFPHSGHVQIALGHDLVVEAPYSGATVRISRLGPSVAIRRPVW